MSEENMQETQQVEAVNPQQDPSTQTSEAETQEVHEQDQNQTPIETDQERNWRALRSSKEETDYQNKELKRQNAEYAAMVKDLVSGKKKEIEPEIEDDDSDIPTLGQTKETINRHAKKIAQDVVSKVLAEREQADAPNRLKREHVDFDTVVSKENVDYLIKNEPELAAILNDITDVYKQGKTAYKFMKTLGIAKKDSVEAMKQDAYRNTAKPVSPNAVSGRNSVGDANIFARGLTPDLKKQLHQEMIDSIKRG